MRGIGTAVSLTLMLLLAAYAAPANPIVGQWDCKSVDERGTEVSWTLTVNQEQGRLSGWIQIGPEPLVYAATLDCI